MTRTFIPMWLAFVVLAVAAADAQAQGGNPNPGILPPGASYRGRTYGEWAAAFWQAALGTPIVGGDHPFISGGAIAGPDGMVFLTGLFAGDEPAEVAITIPTGTPLFIPIINAECSLFEPDPFHGDDEAEMRACANEHMDNTSNRFAVIDGQEVAFVDAYRTESPLFDWGPLPADNIFGAPEGTTSPAVDAGYYLLLAPLSPGEHVIEFGGTFDDFGVSINTRYLITVVPGGK